MDVNLQLPKFGQTPVKVNTVIFHFRSRILTDFHNVINWIFCAADLHWRAFRNQLGEADNVRKVNSHRLVCFGRHLTISLQLLGDARRQHLVQELVGLCLFKAQLVSFVQQCFGKRLSTGH